MVVLVCWFSVLVEFGPLFVGRSGFRGRMPHNKNKAWSIFLPISDLYLGAGRRYFGPWIGLVDLCNRLLQNVWAGFCGLKESGRFEYWFVGGSLSGYMMWCLWEGLLGWH